MASQKSWKFFFKKQDKGLCVWGVPNSFDLSLRPAQKQGSEWIQKRDLLYYSWNSIEGAFQDFFSQLYRKYLPWYEPARVFLTTELEFKDREVAGNRILYLSENTSSRELKLIRHLEELNLGPTESPRLSKEKLLLHVCCGPDAAGVVEQLKENFDLSCFWYDPNIQPREEHDKRLDAFKKVMDIFQVPYIEGPYDVENFETRIKGLEWSPEQGAKCSLCYDQRLEKSAHLAKELGFDCYATTLAISPHKVQQKLIHFGELNFKKTGLRYYHKNFMKEDGFKDSVDFTREHDIYRQDYCGCFYSLHEGGFEAQRKAREWGYVPP